MPEGPEVDSSVTITKTNNGFPPGGDGYPTEALKRSGTLSVVFHSEASVPGPQENPCRDPAINR